jgi:hypothetical protein
VICISGLRYEICSYSKDNVFMQLSKSTRINLHSDSFHMSIGTPKSCVHPSDSSIKLSHRSRALNLTIGPSFILVKQSFN